MTGKRRGNTPRCRSVLLFSVCKKIKKKHSPLNYHVSYLQVVRMRLEEGRRIVGTLIPSTAMDLLVKTLGQGAEESEEVIH